VGAGPNKADKTSRGTSHKWSYVTGTDWCRSRSTVSRLASRKLYRVRLAGFETRQLHSRNSPWHVDPTMAKLKAH